jgi:hypothetical protein
MHAHLIRIALTVLPTVSGDAGVSVAFETGQHPSQSAPLHRVRVCACACVRVCVCTCVLVGASFCEPDSWVALRFVSTGQAKWQRLAGLDIEGVVMSGGATNPKGTLSPRA